MSSNLDEIMSSTLKLINLQQIKIVVAIIAGLIALGVDQYQKFEKDKYRKQNLTYEKQLEVLNQVQSSLDSLKDFVNTQRKQLHEQESVLNNLKSEHQKLRPVVEADKQVVEALFRAQAARNMSSIWSERLIGFLLGVVGSLVASFIFSTIRFRRTSKYNAHQ